MSQTYNEVVSSSHKKTTTVVKWYAGVCVRHELITSAAALCFSCARHSGGVPDRERGLLHTEKSHKSFILFILKPTNVFILSRDSLKGVVLCCYKNW